VNEIEDWTDRAARRMYEVAGLGPRTSIYSILTTAMHRWRSSSWRPFSGMASNAAMPSRSTRAISGSRDRTRSARGRYQRCSWRSQPADSPASRSSPPRGGERAGPL